LWEKKRRISVGLRKIIQEGGKCDPRASSIWSGNTVEGNGITFTAHGRGIEGNNESTSSSGEREGLGKEKMRRGRGT